ncbi:peptidylprolyl isomerase [Spongiimicrobium salis]|uniref:peptidylprolyl isomerase n=1 Tax=Spongiimicrobium salis TaxID=1667022 RepID=UPI00374D7605
MAILENIRKRTTVLILIIGMALFAFVISGVFSSDLGGVKVGSSVGEVNGNEISIDGFRQKMESASRYGGNTSSMQLVNSIWEQEVRDAVLGEQFEDLGINIEQDQIINFIKSNPGYAQNPEFLNESGVFDDDKFRGYIRGLKDNENPALYQSWLENEAAIIQRAKEQTYFNLIKASVGATLKEGELDYKLANDKVNVKYVRVPYTSIADSSITVSKEEISAYIKENEKEYEQENARDIRFVYFQETASLEDEAAIKKAISELIDGDENGRVGLRTTTNYEDFMYSNSSDIPYDSIYKAKKDLPTSVADTLLALNIGDIYGPYRDGNFYKVTKMVNKKANGSVKASHILIAYEGAQRANPDIKRTKEEAETKAKEILAEALKTDAVFTDLARENSDGPSAPRGGDLGYFQEGVMTPKFNDFAFGNDVGHIGLVETDFGFHIVKVDDKQDVVQLATMAREVAPSSETVSALFTDATKFEMATLDNKNNFAELAKENEYLVRPVNKIKEMDENLPGLSAQRPIVQWAFNEDTKIGDIKRFNVNQGYAVVQLTATYKKGLMDVEDASLTALPKIRMKKKAEQILAANQGKSLDALAKDNNVTVSTASALTVKAPTIPGAGSEPLVVGTAFALEEGATSGLIEGQTGIFMVMVTKKEEATKLDNYSTYANTLQKSGAARVNGAVYNALKNAAEIEDKRATFY